MKIKDGFVLRTVAGETIALPTGGMLNMDMMITLNDTGRFLWQCLEKETDEAAMVDALLQEYRVDRAVAERSVAGFVAKLKELDFLA